jgi:hypothetical protein
MSDAKRTWTVVKCSCGDAACKRYGLSVGMFPQGAGFDLADATLAAAAPDLLALAKQYASECGECDGRGQINCYESDPSVIDVTEPCDACADIRAVITKAEAAP